MAAPAAAQQLVERHAPPAPERFGGAVTIGEQDFGSGDPTSLGVNLAGVRLIGPGEDAAGRPAPGITLGTVPDAPEAALRAALSPFLSRPLSLALVVEVQGAVARVWREAGHPFVSVTAPPQEVTSGVLQLRIIEFRMGQLRAEGTSSGRGDRLERGLRVSRGERIDARALEEDLRWLNRHGHRRVEAVFAPGAAAGESDLELRVSEERPVRAFAGWSNSGPAAGRDRFFSGFGAWVPALNDLTVSYQLTGSPDLWANPGRIVPRRGDYPAYLGHSARIVLPAFPRQALEIAPGFVASREQADPLTVFENTTFELPVLYRSALSNIVPGLHLGDVYGGVEFKQLWRTTFFGGAVAAEGSAGLFQLVAGWSHAFTDRLGRTTVDIGLRVNPGGVVTGNDAASWAAFTGGRVTAIGYAYATVGIGRQTVLPRGFGLWHHFSGQLARSPLPDTERLQLGGHHAVRGYGIEDGGADTGFVLRNELRLPALSPLAGSGVADALSPYIFLDAGHGHDIFSGTITTLLGAGLGFDYDIGGHLSVGLAGAVALTDAASTRAGDVSAHARVTSRF